MSSRILVTHCVPGSDLCGAASDASLIVKAVRLVNALSPERR